MVYPESEPPLARDLFAILRTPIPIEFAGGHFDALAQVFPHSEPSDVYGARNLVDVLGSMTTLFRSRTGSLFARSRATRRSFMLSDLSRRCPNSMLGQFTMPGASLLNTRPEDLSVVFSIV